VTLVRVSIGSLSILGLEKIDMLVPPSTLYMLQYSPQGCLAGCRFCPQSATSSSPKELVSRVPWPTVPLSLVLSRRRGFENFSRVCFQTVIKEGFIEEAKRIVGELRGAVPLPISVATTPVDEESIKDFKRLGVERVGVGLDAASRRVFTSVGKPFTWDRYIEFIDSCVSIFGRGRVHIHIILGLGETGRELLETMDMLHSMGAETALFAFTPVKGTPLQSMSPPPLWYYRAAQIARLASLRGLNPLDYVCFEAGLLRAKTSVDIDEWRQAFLTSGCPGCNRPFYNESPGRVYNYPSTQLLDSDIKMGRLGIRR